MPWRNYDIGKTGTVALRNAYGDTITAAYGTGIVLTGRSRVFAGYFVMASLPDHTDHWGEDEHSPRAALLALAANLSALKMDLQCAGVDPRWFETGLSANSGWGYFCYSQEGAVHMMDAMPPLDTGDDGETVDRDSRSG